MKTAPVKERGILFSAPMIRALLDDRKTVTRRIVKPQPVGQHVLSPCWGTSPDGVPFGHPYVWIENGPDYPDGQDDERRSPYGVPGDRLWIKETWRPRIANAGGMTPDAADVTITYAADGAELFFDEGRIPEAWTLPQAADRGWVTPLHMPRWASRITLEVTDVRVERLHDITEEDAIAEGVERSDAGTFYVRGGDVELAEFASARTAFAFLWDGINGDRSPWEANPWVWRLEFRRMP